MREVEKNNRFFLWFIIFIGAITGSLLGEFLGDNFKMLGFLKEFYTVGTSNPFILNMKIIIITFGINFKINIMTIIGIIMAIIIINRKF